MIERFKEKFKIDLCDMEELLCEALCAKDDSDEFSIIRKFFLKNNITDDLRKNMIIDSIDKCKTQKDIQEFIKDFKNLKIMKVREWIEKRKIDMKELQTFDHTQSSLIGYMSLD